MAHIQGVSQIRALAVVVAALMAIAPAAHSQVLYGSLRGNVTDPIGRRRSFREGPGAQRRHERGEGRDAPTSGGSICSATSSPVSTP